MGGEARRQEVWENGSESKREGKRVWITEDRRKTCTGNCFLTFSVSRHRACYEFYNSEN